MSTHVRYEVLRATRNARTLVVSLPLPLVLFYAVASANRHAHTDGIWFPLYFMAGMAAYGALFAVLAPGSRIAVDRAAGWTRQLRLTPLPVRNYFVAKVLTAYLVALLSVLVLFLAGASFGVHLSVTGWLEMTGLLIVGLAPFVLIGIIVGHVISADALPAVVGGLVVLFALLGGAFGELFSSGAMHGIVKALPSYWLVQAGKAAITNGNWPTEGWAVVGAWTVVLVPLAVAVYRRDTSRV
jgi:ABC-2 type transport system permease protein